MRRGAVLGWATLAVIVVSAVSLLSPPLAAALGGQSRSSGDWHLLDVMPTNDWCDFYSLGSTYNGEPVPVGAVIDAYDPLLRPTATPTTPTTTATHTPSITPIPSDTPAMVYVYGRVVSQDTGEGLSGALVRLYRNVGTEWVPKGEETTGSEGRFAFSISPLRTQYRLTEEDPSGYQSITATLPSGVEGVLVDANTIEFALADQTLVGEFLFTDVSRPTPTNTPMNTKAPTPTNTSVPTVTDTPRSTPTRTPVLAPTPTPTPTPGPGMLYGFVWADTNGDGYRQPGEVYEGVIVILSDVSPSMAMSRQRQTTTDENGYYQFEDVEPGGYQLEFDDPQDRFPKKTVTVDAGDIDEEAVAVDLTFYWLHLPLAFQY